MSENHIHDTMGSALAAVRERLVESARRDAEDRVARDAELLLERPKALEAHPAPGAGRARVGGSTIGSATTGGRSCSIR